MSVRSATGEAGFRLDINGLRAWAVAAVVLFHYGVPGFSGGFVGVDIFFVISGFLMAGIVIGSIERGSFSLSGFYLARARRIVPALMVVVLAVLLVGWLILMPSDYQSLGRHARESLLFTSNLRYLAEAGYFDAASHEKWLLHTWSLSVEWQFYLLYPLALIALARWLPGRKALLQAHVLALLVSLTWSIWLVATDPGRAFFLLPARAWELLAGGLVYLLTDHMQPGTAARRNLEMAGFALILLSLFGIDSSLPWPGALALLPTLGTALVLIAARQDTPCTGSVVAQWLGTRSYSIYLWHWPMMVWLTYYGHENEALWIALAIFLSLLLGHVSYHLIEVPARQWLAKGSARRGFTWLLVGVLLMAAAAQLVRRSGFPERLPEPVAEIEAERHNKNPRQEECLDSDARCIFGGPQVSAWVIGDSHADSIVHAVVDALPEVERQGVYFRGDSGCLLVDGANWALSGDRTGCENLRRELASELSSLYPGTPVVLINRVTGYVFGDHVLGTGGERQAPMVYFSRKVDQADSRHLEEFRRNYLETTCRMAKNHPVYIMLPVPEMPVHVPRAMGKAMMRGMDVDISISLAEYHSRHDFVRMVMQEAAERCGVFLLDPVPYLCDEQACHGQKDGMPLYVDDDHLSMRGSRLLVPLFMPIFKSSFETVLE